MSYESPQSAKPGSKALIKSDGSIDGWIGSGCVQPIVIREAKRALDIQASQTIEYHPETVHLLTS
ncbi:MAG TPA: XdhC family protein [Blastocatellia bacterium]|nr:XdhC family protein [Blastocatellia bacterium]